MKQKPVSYYPSQEAARCLVDLQTEEDRPRTKVIDLAVRGFWRLWKDDPDKALKLAKEAQRRN